MWSLNSFPQRQNGNAYWEPAVTVNGTACVNTPRKHEEVPAHRGPLCSRPQRQVCGAGKPPRCSHDPSLQDSRSEAGGPVLPRTSERSAGGKDLAGGSLRPWMQTLFLGSRPGQRVGAPASQAAGTRPLLCAYPGHPGLVDLQHRALPSDLQPWGKSPSTSGQTCVISPESREEEQGSEAARAQGLVGSPGNTHTPPRSQAFHCRWGAVTSRDT